ATGAGQQVRLAVQLQDVGVAGDRPEAHTLRVFGPAHRILAAQAREGVVRRAVQEGIVAGKVGETVVGGGPDRHAPLPCLKLSYKYTKRVHKYVKMAGHAYRNPDGEHRRKRFRAEAPEGWREIRPDRKSTRLNSSHVKISYAVFCLKKKN